LRPPTQTEGDRFHQQIFGDYLLRNLLRFLETEDDMRGTTLAKKPPQGPLANHGLGLADDPILRKIYQDNAVAPAGFKARLSAAKSLFYAVADRDRSRFHLL